MTRMDFPPKISKPIPEWAPDHVKDCDHIIGLICESENNFSIAHPKDTERIKVQGGIGFPFCPLCRGILEDA